MKKWKIPTVSSTSSAANFFSEICEINKEIRNFSQRELGKFLGWPVSYIPDIMKNRKPLTVKRSLEFIQAFRLNPIDAEQMIFMAMTSQFGGEFSQIDDIRKIKSPKMRDQNFAPLFSFKFENLVVCHAVTRLGARATLSRILKLASTKAINEASAKASLDFLLAKGLITRKSQRFVLNTEKSYFADIDFKSSEAREIQKAFLESAKRFYDDFSQPATGGSAFVIINKKRFEQVREKATAFRNWILEVSHQDSNDLLEDTFLFQFEQHLIPVFHPEKLKNIAESDL